MEPDGDPFAVTIADTRICGGRESPADPSMPDWTPMPYRAGATEPIPLDNQAMPLISCSDCGKDISDAAPACIHCGRPNVPPPPRERVAAATATYTLSCTRCGTTLAHPNAWDGGPVDCPKCGAEFDVMDRWVLNELKEKEKDREKRASTSPGVAAVLSLVIPGAGQMYRGRIGLGLLWMLFVVLGYLAFIVPGVLLHLFCIFDAARQGG